MPNAWPKAAYVPSEALDHDIEKLAETRRGIDEVVAAQATRLAEGRDLLRRALEADLGPSQRGPRRRHSSDQQHRRNAFRQIGQGRAALAAALEDDLARLAETRQSLDDMVSEQVSRLSEGRNILKRALEADIDRINESKAEIEELVVTVAATHAERLADGRAALSAALEDDLGKLAETRQDIDEMVSAQVTRLSEGRTL